MLLVATACLPTLAWADGPNCDTDPIGCIGDPCDPGSENYDPDECEDPDPEPDPDSSCYSAQSSVNPSTAMALSRLKIAAARAVKRMEAHRINGALGTALAPKILNAKRSPVYGQKSSTQIHAPAGRVSHDSQKASTSCPAPSRSGCRALALIKLFSDQFVCASQYSFRLGIATDYEDTRRAGEILDQCLADSQTQYAAQLAFCDSLPND